MATRWSETDPYRAAEIFFVRWYGLNSAPKRRKKPSREIATIAEFDKAFEEGEPVEVLED